MVTFETVKDQIAARLAAELPDWLEVADEYQPLAPDIVITTPPPFRIHTTDRNSLDGYPAIELLTTAAVPLGQTTEQAYRLRILVQVTVAGDDEDMVTRWAERYVWALRQLFRTRTPNEAWNLGEVDTQSEQYSRVESGSEIPFVKGGLIEIYVETFEGVTV